MRDLAIRLESRPGALAALGEALGRAGVSIEGGGAFVVDGQGIAHFLFADGAAARRALESAGIEVLADREVLTQRLDQARPGQLGRFARARARIPSTSRTGRKHRPRYGLRARLLSRSRDPLRRKASHRWFL